MKRVRSSCKYRERLHRGHLKPQAVGPDWAIFESSWLQTFFQKQAIFLVIFGIV